MQRKLIKQGGGGYTVYLPKKWIDSQNLNQGDIINILEENNSLVISAKDFGSFEKETILEIKSKEYHTYRSIIGGLYRAGYTKINVKFSDHSFMAVLGKIVNSISGYEIVNVAKNSCIIKSMYELEGDIKKHVQTMINITKSMQDSVIQAMSSNNFDIEEELFQYRSLCLRQRDLIARLIVQKKLFEDFSYYNIAYSLWNVTRAYYTLFKNIEKKKYGKETLDFLEEIKNHFDKTFRKLSEKDAHSRHSKYVSLRNKCCKFLALKKEPLVHAFIITILSSIYSAESSLIALSV